MAEASPQGSTDYFFEERVLKSFTLKVWVTKTNTFPQGNGNTYMETAYFEDSDVRSMNLTWRASYQHEGQTFVTNTCVGTLSLNGSGSGTGRFQKISGFYPGDYGLPTNQRWTMLIPYSAGDDNFKFRVRGQVTGCGRDAAIDRDQSPVPAHVLLPGTVAELAALPVGTQINREYSQKSAFYGTTTTFRYEAVKHATPALPRFVAAPSWGAVGDSNRLPQLLSRKGDVFTDDEPFGRLGTQIFNVKAGTYTITVSDSSKRRNWHLVGAGINLRTSVPGEGTVKWRVRFRPGKVFLYSDSAPAKRQSIKVS